MVFSIANDTLNGKADTYALEQQIQASSITIALESITAVEDELHVIFKAALPTGEEAVLNSVVSYHDGEKLIEPDLLEITNSLDIKSEPPFAQKKVLVNNVEKSLFKRVHGLGITIPAGQTGFLDFAVPWNVCKFTGAEIFGCDLKDTLDFFILDTVNNDYSGAPGSYYVLNQFGFDVEMPPGGKYKNESNYDADLYIGMTVSCAYKNNGAEAKYVAMNPWLHEVK